MTKARPINARQKAFAEHYAACGNATQAARKAGYNGKDATLASMASALLRNRNVAAHLKTLTDKASHKRIATIEDIKALWSQVLNDPDCDMKDRLKASELLGKSDGAFIERRQTEGKVIVEVRRGNNAPAALQVPGKDDEG